MYHYISWPGVKYSYLIPSCTRMASLRFLASVYKSWNNFSGFMCELLFQKRWVLQSFQLILLLEKAKTHLWDLRQLQWAPMHKNHSRRHCHNLSGFNESVHPHTVSQAKNNFDEIPSGLRKNTTSTYPCWVLIWLKMFHAQLFFIYKHQEESVNAPKLSTS